MKRFLLALLLITPLLAFTQSNYHKGYVVINSNDTLKGFIDYKERSRNPVAVGFKSNLTGAVQKFMMADIIAFGIEDLAYFQRFVVNISTDYVEASDLKIGLDLSFRRDTVFLKVLQAGKNLRLFSYIDDLKERFYIQKAYGEEPVELIRNLYLAENGINIVHGNKYIRQLAEYVKMSHVNAGITEKQLLLLKYNEQALFKIVSRINGMNDLQVVKAKYKGSRFFAGAGLLASRAKYVGNHELASPYTQVRGSYLPMAGLGFDLFVNPVIRRALFRAELSFQMTKSDISLVSADPAKFSYRHAFDRMTVSLSPQYIYNIANGAKIKVFAGAGAGLNFSYISKNEPILFYKIGDEMRVNDREGKIERFNYNLLVLGGIVFNKKIEFNAGYSPNAVILNYSAFKAEINQFRFGLNYLFGKP